jgi:hypothetical protein
MTFRLVGKRSDVVTNGFGCMRCKLRFCAAKMEQRNASLDLLRIHLVAH